jgi:hypothetical protein
MAVYLAIAGTQLFVRPIVGMADNGDFPKVLAPRDICDPDHERDAFAYVYPAYIIDRECRWDGHIVSSETVFVQILKKVAMWDYRRSIRITGAGKAHLPLLLAALMILLWALHGTPRRFRFGLPALAVLIFSDVAYVAYLNSFYMDAAALMFLLPTVALAAAWVLRPRLWIAVAFGVVGSLLALAKTQHVPVAGFLACLAIWYAVRSRSHRWYWAASAVMMTLASAAAIRVAPSDINAEPLYNLIFFRMLPNSPSPVQTLTDLGLPESDLVYSGTHAYAKGSAAQDDDWRADFSRRVTFSRLAVYYLQHPQVLQSQLSWGMGQASGIRPNLGNYQRREGFPPMTQAHRFDWWSSLRSWLLRVWPGHVVMFYLVMGVGSLVCFFRPEWAARWPLYPLVMVLAASGIVEFLTGVLLDAVETARHLFLFHVITELLILCALAAVLELLRFKIGMTARELPRQT